MSESTGERSSRAQQVDALIAEFELAAENGHPFNREEFLKQHTQYAVELREYLDDVSRLHAAVQPIQQRPEETEYFSGSAPGTLNSGMKVRYFGAYEILEVLGAGGMGVVYKARQTKLKRLVALKMIKRGQFASEEEVGRFQAEARAAAKLDHPGIVGVIEVGIHHGEHYFAMDYVAGGSLSMLYREQPVAVRHAAELVKKLAEAMDYAHDQGIVHRDLKPANVLLNTHGDPQITDFGLAKRLWSDEDSEGVSMTETGQVLGTAGYMSPEQASGKTQLVGPPADIYALGAILYAMLTTRAPFVGESQADTILQVIQKEPLSPRTLNPSVPRDLETICLKCLEKEPHKRYGTAKLLAEDLARFLQSIPVLARPVGVVERSWRWCRRNPGIATALALVMLVAVVSPTVALALYQLAADKDKALIERGKALGAKDRALVEKQDALKDAEDSLKTARWNTYVARFYNLTTAWRNREWGVLDRMLGELAPKEQEPDFRGWEWHYLRDQYRQKIKVFSPTQQYTFARWSPDGELIAVRRIDHTVELWSAAGQLKGTCEAKTGKELAWSPDSKLVAINEGLSGVKIWDVGKQNLTRILAPQGKARQSLDGSGLDWSRDGKVVVQSGCGWIDVWNPDGTPIKTLTFGRVDGQNNYTLGISLHPIDRTLAMACRSGMVQVMNLDSGRIEWTKRVCVVDCLSVRWSGDGTKLAVGTSYAKYRTLLFDGQGNELHTLNGHDTQILSAAWKTDGTKLVCVGADHHVSVWDPETGRLVRNDHLHNGIIKDVDVRSESSDVVTVGQDGGIRVWSADTEFRIAREVPTGMELREIAWSSSLPWIAAPHGNNVVLIDIASGLEVKKLLGGNHRIDVVAWHPEGHLLAALDMHGDIRIWDVQNSELLNTLQAGSGGIGYFQLAWSPNGRFLASSGNEWAHPGQVVGVHVFDMLEIKGPKTPILVDEHYRGSVAWSNDSRKVAVGEFASGSITLWNVATRQKLWSRKCVSVVHVAYHPNGEQIGVCHTDGSFSLWSASDGERLQVIHRHSNEVVRLYWSPDGTRFVTSSFDGSIRVWDSITLDELLTLPASAERAICWNRDGSQIATGGKERTLRIWGPKTLRLDLKFGEEEANDHDPIAYAKRLLSIFGEVQINDVWIDSVESMPSNPFTITGVRCNSPKIINGAQLRDILHHTTLKHLELPELSLAPEFCQTLLSASCIRRLALRRSQLKDHELAELAKLPQLEFLDIEDTLVTQKGVDELKATRPDLEIRWNSRANDLAVANRLLAKKATLVVMAGQQRIKIVAGQSLPEYPFRLVSLTAEKKVGLTVADFEGLEKLDTLESVDLSHTRLNDEVLAKLSRATNLTTLFCGDTSMTGKPFADFETMPKLLSVAFGSSLSNDSIRHFDKFPNLQGAYLSWSKITDQDLENLPTLGSLIHLECSKSKIQGSGLATLSRFAKLQKLDLSQTLLTDDGLLHLPLLSNLTELNLRELPLTDKSIAHLAQFKSIRKLDLSQTACTAEGIAKLRRMLPGCMITWTAADSTSP